MIFSRKVDNDVLNLIPKNGGDIVLGFLEKIQDDGQMAD